MSKIIFLNGCGSSGKTSVARSIQHLSNEIWLTFGVDTFIDMLPAGKHESYFKFVPGENERGPTMHVEVGPHGNQLFGLMPRFAELLADAGNNLIIDEVLLSDERLMGYAKSLSNHVVYYVGVFCDLGRMQEREVLRRNRHVGLSNDQITRVHQGLRMAYDFKVDTSEISAFMVASDILDFVKNNPNPENFRGFIV